MSSVFNDDERFARLQLIRSTRIGPATFRQLLEKFATATAAIEALPSLIASTQNRAGLRLAGKDQIVKELSDAATAGLSYVHLGEAAYPVALAHIPDPPPVICYAGDLSLTSKPAIAIVGARNASAIGRRFASDLAKDLGREGLMVVSGLARGIDGAAHMAALGQGTIAVVAGGADVIYPPEHEVLTKEIADKGLVLSEMPPGWQPTARDFPRRNRIISGLSVGVIVVEAAMKSGTLITARFAAEQGREVFAVPGSPMDPRCQGTNRLIRDGATLVQSADDVLSALSGQGQQLKEPQGDMFDDDGSAPPDDSDVQAGLANVRELLGFTPVQRDVLIRESDLPARIVTEALMLLVLAGDVEEQAGGYFALTGD